MHLVEFPGLIRVDGDKMVEHGAGYESEPSGCEGWVENKSRMNSFTNGPDTSFLSAQCWFHVFEELILTSFVSFDTTIGLFSFNP